MLICEGIDQLRADPHFPTSALHAAFQHVGHSKLLCYLTQISPIANLVNHYRSATEYFQVRDLGEISYNLILDTISEEGVLLFRTHVFKWQDSDALFGNG